MNLVDVSDWNRKQSVRKICINITKHWRIDCELTRAQLLSTHAGGLLGEESADVRVAGLLQGGEGLRDDGVGDRDRLHGAREHRAAEQREGEDLLQEGRRGLLRRGRPAPGTTSNPSEKKT